PVDVSDLGEGLDRELHLRAVRQALEHLPELQHAVLQDYLGGGGSERELAQRHGMTRYRLRETLVDAVGRVMAEIGEETLAQTPEGRIALSLWREGRTVQDTSRLLGLSVPEVQAARRRFVQRILEQLRSLPSPLPNQGTAMSFDPLVLLKNALLSPNQE